MLFRSQLMITLTEIIVRELQSEVLFSQLDSKVIEGIAVGNAKYANSSLLKVNILIFVQIPFWWKAKT